MSDLKEEKPYPKPLYAWYAVSVLMIAYISSFIDRQILGLLVDDIRRDMQISEFQISLLMGFSFALFYTFLGLPIGRLADTRSRRNIIMVGIFIWSIMTALCGLVKNYLQFFLARVGVGIGEAALSPAAYSMIADYFPKNKLATAISVYSMGIYLGAGLALLIGGAAVELASVQKVWQLPFFGAVFSWQMVFLFIGLPGLLIVLLMFSIKEPERRGLDKSNYKATTLKELYKYMRANAKMVFFHNIALGLLTVSTYSGSYWIPAFLMRNFGWTKSEVGYVYGLCVTIFAAMGIVVGGRIADYLVSKGFANGRQIVILIALIGLLIPMLILPFMSSNIALVVILIPICFFSSFGVGTGATVVQEIMPPQMRAQASAVFLFVVNLLGLGFGPSITALVTQYVFAEDKAVGYSLALVSFVALLLSMLLIYLSIKHYHRSLVYLENWQKGER